MVKLTLIFILNLIIILFPLIGFTKPSNTKLVKPFLPGFSIPLSNKMIKTRKPSNNENYYSNNLESVKQFTQFATFSEGIIKGETVKFFIDKRQAEPRIYFIDGNYSDSRGEHPLYVQFHYFFAQHTLSISMDAQEFNQKTYFTNDPAQKMFIAGTLQLYRQKDSHDTTNSVLGIQFYPQDYIAEETLLSALKVVNSAIKFTDYPLAFVSYGTQQKVNTVLDSLSELNIKSMSVNQIYEGIPYISMQKGITYGFLKLYPKESEMDSLNPLDIPAFNELPLDLSVVAGVITTTVQDAGAHVNLKSKERGTPNLVIRDEKMIKDLEKLNNLPVKFEVSDGEPKIESLINDKMDADAAKKFVENFHAQLIQKKKKIKIKNGSDKEIISFDEMGRKYKPIDIVKKSTSYGGKASKLALLANSEMLGPNSVLAKDYKYRLVPMGFAIPIYYYSEFIDANPELKAKLNNLIDQEMGLNGKARPSPAERSKLVQEVQFLFYKSKVPDDLVQAVSLQIAQLIKTAKQFYPNSPITKVKVRSSANAEDIPNFDGAGLHSSYSAKVAQIGKSDEECLVKISKEKDGVTTKEEVEPESLLCAIKGVYASLWNKRAIEERNFAQIDQRTARMGIAVNVSYNFRKDQNIKEIGNSVLVTRIINARSVYGYRISTNDEDNLVTNPTPKTQSEIAFATFIDPQEPPKLSFLQFAKKSAEKPTMTVPFFTTDIYNKLVDIARKVEISYCKVVPDYYPSGNCDWVTTDIDKPSSLDMEFKIYSNGEILLKQIREFSGH